MTEIWLTGVVLATLGLCLGSYVSTAALRWTEGRSSTFGRSSCDHCGVQLSFMRTTPVLSYVAQRGACTACGGAIDKIHVLGEIAGALVLVTAFAVADPLRAIPLSILGLILLAEVICDAKIRRLPDGLTLTVAIVSTALAAYRSMDALVVGLACAAATFLCLEGVRRGYLKWRGRAGLGFGDVKLLTALSLWLGLQTPWIVVVAALLGLIGMVVRPPVADGRAAFGPYVAFAAWIIGLAIEARLWPTWA